MNDSDIGDDHYDVDSDRGSYRDREHNHEHEHEHNHDRHDHCKLAQQMEGDSDLSDEFDQFGRHDHDRDRNHNLDHHDDRNRDRERIRERNHDRNRESDHHDQFQYDHQDHHDRWYNDDVTAKDVKQAAAFGVSFKIICSVLVLVFHIEFLLTLFFTIFTIHSKTGKQFVCIGIVFIIFFC